MEGIWEDKELISHKNGKPNGIGTFTFANGVKYIGEWKDALFHGYGTLIFGNGDKYVGEFKNGQSHGEGIGYGADGKIRQSGLWKNGQFDSLLEFTHTERVDATGHVNASVI